MMNNLKRKLIIGIITFFIMEIALIGKKNVALAADFSDAVNIPLNGSVMGNTVEGYNYEKDYYKFTVSGDGYVVLNFNNPMQKNSDTYWKMYLYNSNYDEICNININGSKTSTDSTAIGVTAGTYYIKVNSAYFGDEASSTDIYTIKVKYTSSAKWEKEFNENFTDSTPMQINETYFGTIRAGYNYEKDYYSFSTTKNGYIRVCFTNPLQENAEKYWKIYVYNSQYEGLYSQTITGNQESTNLPAIGIAAGKYYIRVESADYLNASSDIYGIKINYEMSEMWEQEINDDFTSATPIVTGGQYSGTIMAGYSNEKDFYQFNISSQGIYSIGLTTPNLNNSNPYSVMYLYDASYQELAKKTVYGNETFRSIVQVLPTGTYYIKLNSTDYNSVASMEPYKLEVTTNTKEEVQANCNHEYSNTYINPTYFSEGYTLYKCNLCEYSYKGDYIAKKVLDKGYMSGFCRTGKGKLFLSWSRVTDATGYQIRYSKKRNFKNGAVIKTIKGNKKTKKTIRKLVRKKKYYVQIRAYKKSGSDIVYGKWSAKKCLKTK